MCIQLTAGRLRQPRPRRCPAVRRVRHGRASRGENERGDNNCLNFTRRRGHLEIIIYPPLVVLGDYVFFRFVFSFSLSSKVVVVHARRRRRNILQSSSDPSEPEDVLFCSRRHTDYAPAGENRINAYAWDPGDPATPDPVRRTVRTNRSESSTAIYTYVFMRVVCNTPVSRYGLKISRIPATRRYRSRRSSSSPPLLLRQTKITAFFFSFFFKFLFFYRTNNLIRTLS